MKVTKFIGLRVEHVNIIQVRDILKQLKQSEYWMHAYIEYGLNDVLFYPNDLDIAYDFLDQEGVWCFDYEPQFKITIMFMNEEDAVLSKLQILLDIEDISIIT